MNAALRKIGALASKDFADLFKNPTMLVVCLMPVGFMFMYRFIIGDITVEADGGPAGADMVQAEFLKFNLGSALCMAIGMVASMVVLYGIAEEKEKHTLRTLMLANVNASEVVVAKGAVALIAVLAVGTACYFVAAGPLDLLPVYLVLAAAGAAPVILASLVLGLACRDQMSAGFYSVPVLLLALVPPFGMMNETMEAIAGFTPLGGIYRLMGLAVDGRLLAADALGPLAVTAAWIVAGAAVFAALFRRLSRDN